MITKYLTRNSLENITYVELKSRENDIFQYIPIIIHEIVSPLFLITTLRNSHSAKAAFTVTFITSLDDFRKINQEKQPKLQITFHTNKT